MSKYWPLLLLPTSKFFQGDGVVSRQSGHVVKESQPTPDDWTRMRPADSDYQFQLHIGVKQGNLAGLEQRLLEVSDPSHPSYGRHLSAEQVNALVAPTDEAIAKLHAWLASHGIVRDQLRHSPAGDWIRVPNVTVARAEALLQTSYHVYRRRDGSGTDVVRAEHWSLPPDLHGLVDTIHPTSTFFLTTRRNATEPTNPFKRPGSLNDYAEDVPDGLAILNGIDVAHPPSDLTPERACNVTAVTPLCLRALYGTLNYTAAAATPQVPGGRRNRMALVNFSGEFNNRTDARRFLATYRPDAVAAADDFSIVEIAGGINRQGPSTAAQIATGDGREGGLDAQVLLGVGHPTPLVTYTVGGEGGQVPWVSGSAEVNDNEPFLVLIDWLLTQRDEDLPTVLSISYADTERTVPPSYAARVCAGFAQLGARGVSVIFGSGDWGVGRSGQCLSRSGQRPRFAARFPDGCPWVTSVGATRGVRPQVVAHNTRNGFVSGGGLSELFPRPAYQEDAVRRYLAGLGGRHADMYNGEGRAYPDVAAMGYRMVTVWNGGAKMVDGTSASAPVWAAVVALLNDARMAAGRAPLGFLNPWIYKVAGPGGGFTDVVSGSTRGCNTSGFPATEGWDLASGFGTPWFPKLLELAMGEADDAPGGPVSTGPAPTSVQSTSVPDEPALKEPASTTSVLHEPTPGQAHRPWYIPPWL
ncbi:tripeptidyl peptidase [Cordyceps fumosorosea ARSEF 2679]|uniref:tripeptidyl-peptidase II n=1 Tax=Cordyceps fumosorosea (strain ARSEF 2679) TaxID=1081104 RepID=A0A162KFK0_CORFA|nr:tripeptidyl peptidase [Cordyceps fumosorosea ARSEF 2679]OAA74188.1 tripeptidyl peptidase [Cordyceps fumosorosea ARSEF 2679]